MIPALPAGYQAVPFRAEGGLPQTVPVAVAGTQLLLTLAAVVADVPRLLNTPGPAPVSASARGGDRAAPVPATPDDWTAAGSTARAWATRAAPDSLGARAVTPYVVVRAGDAVVAGVPLVATRPVLIRTPGVTVSLVAVSWDLPASAFRGAGGVGGHLVVGIAAATDVPAPGVATGGEGGDVHVALD